MGSMAVFAAKVISAKIPPTDAGARAASAKSCCIKPTSTVSLMVTAIVPG